MAMNDKPRVATDYAPGCSRIVQHWNTISFLARDTVDGHGKAIALDLTRRNSQPGTLKKVC